MAKVSIPEHETGSGPAMDPSLALPTAGISSIDRFRIENATFDLQQYHPVRIGRALSLRLPVS
jgi:hypothetical protein